MNGSTTTEVSTKHTRRNRKNKAQTNSEHKIMIIGDSHARGLSGNVKNNLDEKYSVCGFVKPGVNIATQISSMTVDTTLLTKNDLIIFWGGSNYVNKNNSQEGLKHLENFVQSNSHTNIFLMCVPPRHDLLEWTCVNNETKRRSFTHNGDDTLPRMKLKFFNKKLLKLIKLYKHVLIVMADTDRKFYSRHGLHMNNLSKEKIASKFSTIVKNIFQKQNVKISLFWKNGYDMLKV